MQSVNDLMDKHLPTKPNQSGPTDSQENTSQTPTQFKHDKEVFVGVWRALQAARHITKDEAVGGTEYTYWRLSLAALTNDDLKRGMGEIKNFNQYMTLGAFRDLCQTEEHAPYHKPYNPNQIEDRQGVMTPEARKQAMKKLREEVGL